MRTLRHRLTVTHTLIALLAVALMAVLAGGLIARSYIQLAGQRAAATAQRVGVLLQPAIVRTNGDWELIRARVSEQFGTAPIADERRIVVADANWTIQLDNRDEAVGDQLPARWRIQATPIRGRANGTPIGYVVVPIGGDNQSLAEQQFMRSIIVIVATGSLVSISAALITALLLSRRLTGPLQTLTQAAQKLAAGQQHEPIRTSSDRELNDLAQAFNSMAAELARQESLRQHMLADITHELRTPLSVLRLQIESLEDGIEQPTPAVLASLHQEVELLTRLVSDLRLISLADAGQLSLTLEPLSPQQAIEHSATIATARARQQGIALQVARNGQLPPVLADQQRLTQVLGNLVENALRYTPQGGQITLGVEPSHIARPATKTAQYGPQTGHWLVFTVADTGQGIAPTDLPHIFDRFYRTDRARARETGGSGLGLSIVERLVKAQGGWVDVQSTVGKGTTFQVALPIAPQALAPYQTQRLTN